MGDIRITGAKVHNLKNVDVTIPRDSLTVVTGLSGSGKSSLAFDTLYAEGQRRYVESLSAYARQFLDRLAKPDVEKIEGLSPAISIEQHTTGGNPRSIVATVTEIHDYLRILYGSAAVAHCPKCGRKVTRQSAEEIVEGMMEERGGHDHEAEEHDHETEDHDNGHVHSGDSSEAEHEEADEHVWTSPVKAAEITEAIARKIAQIDPEHAETYLKNAKAYEEQILELDAQYRQIAERRLHEQDHTDLSDHCERSCISGLWRRQV